MELLESSLCVQTGKNKNEYNVWFLLDYDSISAISTDIYNNAKMIKKFNLSYIIKGAIPYIQSNYLTISWECVLRIQK